MAPTSDSWMREFNEASRLADEISDMISARSTLPPTGPETQRHLSATRRKVVILRTRLETLHSLLSTLSDKQSLSKKEMKRRHDMLNSMMSKANQMAGSLNMNNLLNRESLLGQDTKAPDVMSGTTGLDNQGLVGLQRQVIKEQDQDLEKLEETVISTKHVALAINEELNLHTRLLDNLEDHVDSTNSRVLLVQRKLAILSKRTKGGCSALLLLVLFVVILIGIIWVVVKYL